MKKNFSITAHCMVKNEQVYMRYVLQSVIDYVDRIIVFDTGSSDDTPKIVNEFVRKYPGKVELYIKPPCDWASHIAYRMEFLEMTKTDWFMILDGDEVWSKRTMDEAFEIIEKEGDKIDCVDVESYLCTGDIFHEHNRKLVEKINGIKSFSVTRFFKFYPGQMKWSMNWKKGDVDFKRNGLDISENREKMEFTKNKLWHMTHLRRSYLDDNEFTSNSVTATRKSKRRDTYFIIGQKIEEDVPEVFDEEFKKINRVGFWRSFFNFWPYFGKKVKNKLSLIMNNLWRPKTSI